MTQKQKQHLKYEAAFWTLFFSACIGGLWLAGALVELFCHIVGA